MSYASHCAHIDSLRDTLMDQLAGILPGSASCGFYSTVEPGRFEGSTLDAGYWVRNLRQPVRFYETMQCLLDDGHRFFLEISPHPVLTLAMESTLDSAGVRGAVTGTLRRDEGDMTRALRSVGDAVAQGLPLEGEALFSGLGGRTTPLPTYAFQRERYWLQSRRRTADAFHARGQGGHPLIGSAFQMSAPHNVRFWERAIALDAQPWLRDHKVESACLLPAAGFVEMALAAATEAAPGQIIAVEDLALDDALVLSEDTPAPVQVALSETGAGAYGFTASTLTGGEWRKLVGGRIALAVNGAHKASLAEAQAQCDVDVDVDAVYEELGHNGLRYGPAFRGLAELRRGTGRALGLTRLPESAPAPGAFQIHPALLDACFHVASVAALDSIEGGPFVPVRIDRVRIDSAGLSALWCSAKMTRDGAGFRADLTLWDEDGAPVGAIEGLACAPLDGAATQTDPLLRALLQVSWQPLDVTALEAKTPDRWLVVGDAPGITRALEDRGATVVAGDDIEAALPLQGVVCAAGLGAPSMDGLDSDALVDAGRASWESALRTAQLLADKPLRDPPRLVLVSHRAQPIENDSVRPEQALLVGLGATLRAEQDQLRPMRIDLAEPSDAAELDTLAALALSDSDEDQVAVRGDRVLAARLERHPPPAPARTRTEPAAGRPHRLHVREAGTLDALELVPLDRPAPAAGEVEIAVDAAGLNFLDVLTALGEIPPVAGDSVTLGGELAGRITRVGPGVEDLSPGQRVLSVTRNGFATHAIAPAMLTVPIPDALSAVDAATLPVAGLTAYISLHHVARLEPGERVLIHSAAGGVGQAAMAWARHVGARIFATAGTEEKRARLLEQGAEAVSDSRSDAFVADVLAWSDGHGVDVVLNSLASPLLEKTFSLVADDGRFVEIGKRDYFADRQLGLRPFLKGISYTLVDLVGMILRTPQKVRRRLDELMDHVRDGVFAPLPSRAFPLAEAPDVFREMARGQHVGKLVLTVDAEANPNLEVPVAEGGDAVRTDGAYLITGGLGGLGLSVAEWLAEAGAGQLVLLGRRGVTRDDQREAIARMEAAGARVTVASVDVSDRDALAHVIEGVPLRGVVHTAGILDDALLADQSVTRFHAVMAPKVAGAWHLHTLTRDLPLDFFVLYGSATSVLAAPGQANYAASNAFLGALAHYRRGLGLPALTLDWGAFAEVGLAAERDDRGARLATQGIQLLTPADGQKLFGRLVASDVARVAPCPLDVRAWIDSNHSLVGWPYLEALLADDASDTLDDAEGRGAWLEQLRGATDDEAAVLLTSHVVEELARVLRADPATIDLSTPFKALGVDSLMGLELRNRLQRTTGVSLPATSVWTFPTPEALGAHLAERLCEGLAEPEPEPEAIQDVIDEAADGEELEADEELGDEELDDELLDALERLERRIR